MTVSQFPGRQYGLPHNGDELPFHPIASVFPLMERQAIVDLKNDIAKHGLLEPIVLLDGKVLDGRNRFLACHGLWGDRGGPDSGFEPPVRFWARSSYQPR